MSLAASWSVNSIPRLTVGNALIVLRARGSGRYARYARRRAHFELLTDFGQWWAVLWSPGTGDERKYLALAGSYRHFKSSVN